MNNVRFEFQKRVGEINLYFNAIELLDAGSCKLNCEKIDGSVLDFVIDSELSKILKANGFILLYNLMEATIRNSIDAVISSMHSDQVKYSDLSVELKKLWLNQEINSVKDLSVNIGAIKSSLLQIMETIIQNELLVFNSECVKISGNIDARIIRQISKQLGCKIVPDGSSLLKIKEKRNKLAHGEFTFTDIGKDYTINDLLDLKLKTIDYLNLVIDEIEWYDFNKSYKC